MHKISKEGPVFPEGIKITSLSFSFLYNEKTWSVKYVPDRGDSLPGRQELHLDSGGMPTAPKRGYLSDLLTTLFSEVPFGKAVVETNDPLPTPFVSTHTSTRYTPDYLATIKSRPEIELSASQCDDPLIPWRYRLPKGDWVELDALGVKDMGFHEELEEYLKGCQ